MTKITRSFTVISKPIKKQASGTLDYCHYLNDMEHPNHLNKTTYLQIHKSPVDIGMKAIKEASEVDLKNAKSTKGGRPTESYLQSFVFSPPNSFNLTDEQFKILAIDIVKCLSDRLGVDTKTLLDNCHFSVHKQENAHLNMIISRNINGSSYQQILTRPSTTNLLRREFNATMLKFGYDYNDYRPLSCKQTIMTRLNKKESEIDKKISELKELTRLNKKARNQFQKLLIAFDTKNEKDIVRQSNRINKTIDDYLKEDLEREDVKELMKSIQELEFQQNRKILKRKFRNKYNSF